MISSKVILQRLDIDKVSNRLEFGISNRASANVQVFFGNFQMRFDSCYHP